MEAGRQSPSKIPRYSPSPSPVCLGTTDASIMPDEQSDHPGWCLCKQAAVKDVLEDLITAAAVTAATTHRKEAVATKIPPAAGACGRGPLLHNSVTALSEGVKACEGTEAAAAGGRLSVAAQVGATLYSAAARQGSCTTSQNCMLQIDLQLPQTAAGWVPQGVCASSLALLGTKSRGSMTPAEVAILATNIPSSTECT